MSCVCVRVCMHVCMWTRYNCYNVLLGKRDKKTSTGLSKWNAKDVCWPPDREQVPHHRQELQC